MNLLKKKNEEDDSPTFRIFKKDDYVEYSKFKNLKTVFNENELVLINASEASPASAAKQPISAQRSTLRRKQSVQLNDFSPGAN
jgi:hypothetical protein